MHQIIKEIRQISRYKIPDMRSLNDLALRAAIEDANLFPRSGTKSEEAPCWWRGGDLWNVEWNGSMEN